MDAVVQRINMDEVRLAAKAYFENSSPEFQGEARKFYAEWDTDGDGLVSSSEFALLLRKLAHAGLKTTNLLALLDANEDGTLDFWELTAYFYFLMMREGGCFCDGCSALLPGLFFTCVECYEECSMNSFDLCTVCYGGKKFSHRHTNFMDNYVILRKFKKALASYESQNTDRTDVHLKRAVTTLEGLDSATNLVDTLLNCSMM